MKSRKGIILAGGTGTRLYPITKVVSKQLLPLYDKPMIYYPLSTLMLGGIKEVLIITTPEHKDSFIDLLGYGENLGMEITYEIQPRPEGLAQAFIIGEKFLDGCPCALILGDNFFYGDGLPKQLRMIPYDQNGAIIFGYRVSNPKRYGVIEFDSSHKVINIEEKPREPKSNYAVVGLYFYDSTVVEKAKKVEPSSRGELEISSINNLYIQERKLSLEIMGRGYTWIDTGTYDSMYEAVSFVRTVELRQGLKIGCPEEISWRLGWITGTQLELLADKLNKSGYGDYLKQLLYDENNKF